MTSSPYKWAKHAYPQHVKDIRPYKCCFCSFFFFWHDLNNNNNNNGNLRMEQIEQIELLKEKGDQPHKPPRGHKDVK